MEEPEESNEIRSCVVSLGLGVLSTERFASDGVKFPLFDATSGRGLNASGGVGEADIEVSSIVRKLEGVGGGEGLSWALMILLARTDDGSDVKQTVRSTILEKRE